MKQVNENTYKNVTKVLIGNKCDSVTRAIPKDDAKLQAMSYKIPLFETSAKLGLNVQEPF